MVVYSLEWHSRPHIVTVTSTFKIDRYQDYVAHVDFNSALQMLLRNETRIDIC